ncbi:hypothetical protein SDC9_65585 [bioreactor metagenome]|uniref:Uncharacterized protein n=1 Tax=bioreactor metagenome TaxID=1076179 RepID=A0A644XTD1_9ZZZZ
MASLKYWLWLTNLRGLSPRQTFAVLEHFGTPEGAFFADPAEYSLVEGLSKASVAALGSKSMSRAEEILESCDALNVRILTVQDAEYPHRLRELFDPPSVLYVRGKLLPVDEEVTISVVGSREPTPYGIQVAGELGLELARSGALVISGIARGIDSAALRGALSGGGSVISVLGNGVDVIYPAQNRELYEDVASVGALISEYAPGTSAAPEHFPIRNRIISGLSLGTVVVEGSERSGSLITARLALEQNRDVFAVPGNVGAPMSRGPNLLIRRGEAKLVTKAWDVLEDYASCYPHKVKDVFAIPDYEKEQRLESVISENIPPVKTVTEEEQKPSDKRILVWKEHSCEYTDDQRDILLTLSDRAKSADEIIEETQIPARRVFSALTLLQVKGVVTEGAGKRFSSAVMLKL